MIFDPGITIPNRRVDYGFVLVLFGSSALFNALDPKESRSRPEEGQKEIGMSYTEKI